MFQFGNYKKYSDHLSFTAYKQNYRNCPKFTVINVIEYYNKSNERLNAPENTIQVHIMNIYPSPYNKYISGIYSNI